MEVLGPGSAEQLTKVREGRTKKIMGSQSAVSTMSDLG
jgi:hypothetical protein